MTFVVFVAAVVFVVVDAVVVGVVDAVVVGVFAATAVEVETGWNLSLHSVCLL